MYHFDLTIDMEIYESSLRNEAVFVLTILVESPKWYLYNVKDPVFLRGLFNVWPAKGQCLFNGPAKGQCFNKSIIK